MTTEPSAPSPTPDPPDAPAPPDTPPPDPRRERLFQAAAPLFERYGYRKTTIEEICRQAGMSKRTYYEIFSDKADLFIELMESLMNREALKWEAELPEDLDPLGRMHALVDLYERIIRENPSMMALMEDIEIMRKFSDRMEQVRFVQMGGTLHTILTEGIASGRFREMEAGIAVWLIFSLLDTVYMLFPALMGIPGALENRTLAEETRNFIVHALGAGEEQSS